MSGSRRQYPFHLIEPKWQRAWEEQQTFRAWNPGDTLPHGHAFAKRHGLEGKTASAEQLPPKYYILDMFPYPSGAGLHVGHPEGYTATDILARYRRARGYHVLHPMGWDAFGLPAEQYAIKTGQHPRKTTEQNIATFKRQIQSLGFSYDWTREVDTTNPNYFKWTQWIFLQLYNSWFNPDTNKAEPIETLDYPPELQRAAGILPAGENRQQDAASTLALEAQRRAYRDSRRLAYVAEAPVWWCEQLGTVLANEEVSDGKSEVGDFPVVRRPMRQWMLRITAYAERLLNDLDSIDWSHSLKEMQRNWIGRSEGAEVEFEIAKCGVRTAECAQRIQVFTTRPDTLFGATYMVLAPEHELVDAITTAGQRSAVNAYKSEVARKSDLERTQLAKEKTGVFTGAFAVNPATGEKISIWIADYVLASYGTGAIMAVPGHDERDFEFATKFNLPIVEVVAPAEVRKTGARPSPGAAGPRGREAAGGDARAPLTEAFIEDGIAVNSAGTGISLDGLPTSEAKHKITAWLEAKGLGKRTINYKLRDWLFSRQRYWGEPFPILWKQDANGNWHHEALPESALPLLPPALDDYRPAPDGQPPLARAKDWVNLPDGSKRETNTMPQWAGSCWYYLRYLDAHNDCECCGREPERYWMGAAIPSTLNSQPSTESTTPGVDLYVGGTEHAVLHLLYARFWHKVLYDLGHVSTPEPFFKLVNQGLILGQDGQKMSKSRGNVVNPDEVLKEYGADAFRLYEMFMGPLQDAKPWSTQGVEGVYRFLGRVWRLLIDEQSETEFAQTETTTTTQGREELLALIQLSSAIKDTEPTKQQLKVLHACIKKVTEDLDHLRFNTAISAMMVFINEAMTWETRPYSVMRDFVILLHPFAPHLAEELWVKLATPSPLAPTPVELRSADSSPHTSAPGETTESGPKSALQFPPPSPEALAYAAWPEFNPAWLAEDTLEYPVQVNGKLRDKIFVATDATQPQIESAALAAPKVRAFIAGKTVKRVIVVPKKLVNIVVG